MRKIKVLQLASFEGNIGDNANITGTRNQIKKNLNFEIEFFNLEIREFFWGERKYDNHFVELVNKFDLFIFGGGNFFELWVDASCNNTSVDLPIEILKKISTPTIFYALGLDIGMGYTKKGVDKFKKWLDYIITQERFILSLRNDGSYSTAIKVLGEEYSQKFLKLPDGGFFTKYVSNTHCEIESGKKIIGLNLAGDMLDVRFPANIKDGISYEEFLLQLGDCFNKLFYEDENLRLILYPHIYKDLKIISEFLKTLKDKYARTRVTVAPYLHGFKGHDYILDSYSLCDLIMGNRFHTNVCGIGMNIPTIGFINYPQIEYLYDELGLNNRAIRVNVKGFEKELYKKILETFEFKKKIQDEYKKVNLDLLEQSDTFHRHINNWFSSINS